ncbi:GntR family transcriptional regulator [Falsihalocynthiibacter sp. SS001]|uniref:GntR family transcriptional regulator n=1 Tax=Falsihalocynthiibacter sp. SS001 TaxID=3349698 RepID=UPI0036D24638
MALPIDHSRAQSATEVLHDLLFRQIISTELEPGQKISEAEIAGKYEVSRQPVRDAFYRLAQQGLLRIRPQRSTVITHISISALHQARFIRIALEKEIMLAAAQNMTPEAQESLSELIELQEAALANDSDAEFYRQDDKFHEELCKIAGQPYIWELICNTKAPADRVRFLSLAFDGRTAIADHKQILQHLIDGNGAKAADLTNVHLSRVLTALPRIQAAHPDRFKEAET